MLLQSSGVIGVFDPDPSLQSFNSIEHAYLNAPIYALSDVPILYGYGLYGIYYLGDPLPYAPDYDCATPIYFGKTIPEGWETGASADAARSQSLYKRINRHRTSIDQVVNLHVADFLVRLFPLAAAWIGSAESFMIRRLSPVWNLRLRGFGNNSLGACREDSEVSPWDRQHPGRHRVRAAA